MKEKKEMSNVVVYFLIVFLLIFIVIPPVLRAFVPKREENVPSTPKEKIVLLTCNKTSEDQQYKINSKTKFLNGEAVNVLLTYQKPVSSVPPTPENGKENNTSGDDTVLPSENVEPIVTTEEAELDIFRNLKNATIVEDEAKFSITMNQETLSSNSDVEFLSNYFGLLSNQKKYYEGLGYICTKVES